LLGLPIRAHTGSFVYRTRKFVARNRVLCALLALLSITLVATGLWIVRQSIETEARAAKLEQINAFLGRIVSWPDPDSAGRDLRFLDALDAITSSLDDQFRDDPGTRASLHTQIGLTYHRLGESERGRDHVQR